MAYRLTRAAEEQINALLLDSARTWGLEAAGRYGQLIRYAALPHPAIYRLVSDGATEILGLVHDCMVLSRAARKIVWSADKR